MASGSPRDHNPGGLRVDESCTVMVKPTDNPLQLSHQAFGIVAMYTELK